MSHHHGPAGSPPEPGPESLLSRPPTHFVVYPFQLSHLATGGGGLESVLGQVLNRRIGAQHHDRVKIISTDTASYELPERGAAVVAVDPDDADGNEARFDAWFQEAWAYLHPRAYTLAGHPAEVLRELFRAGYASPPGSLEQMLEHFARYGTLATGSPDRDCTRRFCARFDSVLADIPAHAVVNWQDFVFLEAMLKHGPRLAANGVYQTLHLHSAFPRQIGRSPWGQRLLQAVSLMNAVYLHTDLFKQHAQEALAEAGLPVPRLARFDLGLDTRLFDEAALAEGLAAPGDVGLSVAQSAFLKEVLWSREQVPHRFACIDRVDPGKGVSIVLTAIERHLDGTGRRPEELRKRYRFFHCHHFLRPPKERRYSPKEQYARVVRLQIERVQQKYPGVLLAVDGMPRSSMPAILTGCHLLTGGVDDGLNLACQEGLYVNALTQKDTTAIIGTGAGFAMHCRAGGFQELACFPRCGSAGEFKDQIDLVVRSQREQPGRLRNRTQALVEKVILRRVASILVDRPDRREVACA